MNESQVKRYKQLTAQQKIDVANELQVARAVLDKTEKLAGKILVELAGSTKYVSLKKEELAKLAWDLASLVSKQRSQEAEIIIEQELSKYEQSQ